MSAVVEIAPVRQEAPAVSYAALAATLAGAGLLALSEAAGASFVALALAFATVVLVAAWPVLTASAGVRGSRVALAAGGLGMAAAAGAAGDAPTALRAIPAITAIALILAFFGQLLRGDSREGVVSSLVGDAAGLAVLISGMTLPALVLLRGADRPVAIAMAGVGLAVLADLVPWRWRALRLVGGLALGVGGGLLAAALVPTAASTAVAALLGGAAGLVSVATRVSLRELPAAALPGAAPVIAAAGLLAPGAVAYTIGRLLLG